MDPKATKSQTSFLALKTEKGSAVIEAALIMPVLFLVFMGLLEFGQILRIQQAITHAAREGARIGAIQLDDTKAISSARDVTQDYLNRTGVDLSSVIISPDFSLINGTDAIQVTIDYGYTSNLTGWIPGLDTFELRSRVIMRREA